MKSRIIVFMASLIVILGIKDGWAQREWHVSSTKALEMSLGSLKQSAQEMAKRNQWLISEIQMLELKMEELKNPTMKLSDKLPYYPAKEPVLKRKAKLEPLKPVEIHPLNREKESSLLKRLESKSGKEVDLLKSIKVVQENINYLNGELGYSQDVNAYMGSEKVADLQSKLQLSQRNVDQLERRLKAVEKENAHSFNQNKSLEEKNYLLKQKFSLLKEKFDKTEIQEKDVMRDIKRLESQNSTFLSQMQGSIGDLKSKGKDLEKVLSQASKKMDQKDAIFKITDQEIEMLTENLTFIEQENLILKNKYSKLESDLERLNLTADNR